jgi:membrane protein
MTAAFDTAARTRVGASVVSILGLLWAGLALVHALEAAFGSVWQVDGRGIKSKLYAVLWLAGAVLILGASAALTTVQRGLPPGVAPFTIVVTVAINIVLCLWTFKVLTNRPLPWSAFVPGAIAGGVGLQVLTILGATYVPRTVAASSALYGTLGVVLALLAWLLLFGRLMVYAAIYNVVRWERSHGTVTVEVQLPRMPGDVPLGATRAGAELRE